MASENFEQKMREMLKELNATENHSAEVAKAIVEQPLNSSDTEFHFNLDPQTFLEQLRLGILIIMPKGLAILRDGKAFPADEISNKAYLPAQDAELGTITGARYRSTVLSNITVANRGLVMPTALDLQLFGTTAKRIEGPGRVSTALEIGNEESRKLIIENAERRVLRFA